MKPASGQVAFRKALAQGGAAVTDTGAAAGHPNPPLEARTRRDGRTVYGYPGTWNPEDAA